MQLFPWITEQFYSALPSNQVIDQVQANLPGPFTWHSLFAAKASALFRGEVKANTFTLRRTISYQNSWLPQITGWVEPDTDAEGSIVILRHRVRPAVLTFGAVWFLGVVLAAIRPFWLTLATGIFAAELLIPLGMLTFGLVLFTGPFWLEVRKSRHLLINLLQLQQ
ncbi:hypothetical protein LGH70_06445 [Hymenobacter sp. BT635]|uniref:Uncharacterized protein n=1 Tax=Hymenobacter nitidus TaxID=2880929 RepID=A0ABS8ADW9_9BACT|nr:hypothetical protein [Hymenobacter nitidus]MCB2377214.1 hypothetical protein [Hymenobacter nitidus]